MRCYVIRPVVQRGVEIAASFDKQRLQRYTVTGRQLPFVQITYRRQFREASTISIIGEFVVRPHPVKRDETKMQRFAGSRADDM